jgi:hypothetical protein
VAVVIVVVMFSAYNQNDLLLSMMRTLVGDGVDLEPVRQAFEFTRGDFTAKFTAAVQARLAQLVVPEVFIDLPEHPEELRKADLEVLVRPAADGFLRSYPTKDELLDQAGRIRRRQERRPAWIPRLDRDGKPMPGPEAESADAEPRPERPLVVTALAELGDVSILLPAPANDRPELAMAPGGIGEWGAALYAVLGVTGERGPAATVPIDAQANEALVPDGLRWWSTERARLLPAAQDPGVASELLATSVTLGGLAVSDNTVDGYEAVAGALASAGDWRYSPRWLLDGWSPGDDARVLAACRACIAGWADEGRSGLIVYVYGGALHSNEGLFSVPGPLHNYLLCVTRSADGTDPVAAVHRVILSCPGENWCHRGGCPDAGFPEVAALLTPVVTAGEAAQAADGIGGWAGEAYARLYGASGVDGYADSVLDHIEVMPAGTGWVELDRSTWEGGLEESLLRRGQHCLTASYDPVTRQVRLVDGKPELEATLDLLADDGVLTGGDDQVSVDTSEATVERWGTDLLTAAEDLLRGRIAELPQPAAPVQGGLLGLHPHADGTPRGPESTTLVDEQLAVLLRTAGVISNAD